MILVSTWENVPYSMCTQRRLSITCASVQSDVFSLGIPWILGFTGQWDLWWDCADACTGWFESSPGVHAVSYIFSLYYSDIHRCYETKLIHKIWKRLFGPGYSWFILFHYLITRQLWWLHIFLLKHKPLLKELGSTLKGKNAPTESKFSPFREDPI